MNALSARKAGGEGGAHAKRGRVRWVLEPDAIADERSRCSNTHLTLPSLTRWAPPSPPPAGAERA